MLQIVHKYKYLVITFMLGVFIFILGGALRIGHYYKYDRAGDDTYALNKTANIYNFYIDGNVLRIPKIMYNDITAFIEIHVDSRLYGELLSPHIKLTNGSITIFQFFEPGAEGIRYLNISKFFKEIPKEQLIEITGGGVSWQINNKKVYTYENPELDKKRILVLSPHPDDAEIAAFGLYSNNDSHIVTITAGERGRDIFNGIINDESRYFEKGVARTIDSISIPLFGNIKPDKCWNLGYFTGKLKLMSNERSKEQSSDITHINDISIFRKFNIAELPENSGKSTWNNLIADLIYILDKVKPDIIVTPYPALDNHPDHKYTTAAVIEALQKSKLPGGNLLLYTNHARLTEIYPFGPNYSHISLPPMRGDMIEFEKIYSHEIEEKLQTRKLIALEAMHDLREYDFKDPSIIAIINIFSRQIVSILKSWRHEGTDYFRRGARPNELFFIIPYEQSYKIKINH